MDTFSTVTCLVVILAVFMLLSRYIRSRSLPPGPIGLPIFGSFLHIALACYRYDLEPYEVLSNWVSRYGNVFSFWLGNKLTVVVNDVASAKEGFMSADITDRPMNTLFEGKTGGTGKNTAGTNNYYKSRHENVQAMA